MENKQKPGKPMETQGKTKKSNGTQGKIKEIQRKMKTI